MVENLPSGECCFRMRRASSYLAISKGQQAVNLFSGIVRCGGCGQNMVRRTVSKNGKKYIYLHCVTNHNGLGCSSHLISESKLAEVVLAALQGKVQQISGLEHRLDEINEIPKNERRLKSVEEHLKMLEQEEQKYQTLRRQLYEDMSSGIVSKEEYKEFSHSFNEKVEAIRKAKAEMNRQRDCLNNLDFLSAGQCATGNGGPFVLNAAVARGRSTSNADRWICDFYDTTGGRQRSSASGTGGSNASAGVVHIRCPPRIACL